MYASGLIQANRCVSGLFWQELLICGCNDSCFYLLYIQYDVVSCWLLSNLLSMVSFTIAEEKAVVEAEASMSSLCCKQNKMITFHVSWNMDASAVED